MAQSTTGFVTPGNNHVYFADININEHSFFQDVNGDGAADYIWTGSTPSQSGFFVWLNNGTGSFSTSFIHSNLSNLLTGETNAITTGTGCVAGLDTDGDGIPDFQDTDSDNDGFTDEEENDFGSDPYDPNDVPGVVISAKVVLMGAILDPVNPGTPLTVMRDDLRSANFLPATSPYGGSETVTVTATNFADNGNDAVVDWVQLELRDATTPSTIVATLAALVQRDGDVMDVNGSTILVFRDVSVGSYFVAVTHRNHLGAMTAAPVGLSGTPATVDFFNFSDTSAINGFEQATANSMFALWAGDANGDGRVIFNGQHNDIDTVFTAIDHAPGNLFGLSSFVLRGYRSEDVNLNGDTIFTGEDGVTLFNIVDGHPLNVFGFPTFVIFEQIP